MPDGRALHGRVVLITGATSALGRAAALALARMGPCLYLACRDPDRAATAVAEIAAQTGHRDVRVLLADLSVQAEVRRVADAYQMAKGRFG